MKLNIGCGHYPLPGYVNLDSNPATPADLHVSVPPLPFQDHIAEEIYLGHIIEHFTRPEALALLDECRRVLTPDGVLGVVVPDTRELMSRYVSGHGAPYPMPDGSEANLNDLDMLSFVVIYSYMQDSPHRWSYDLHTLGRLLRQAGFTPTSEIDRHNDPRLGSGAWYQCGLNARPR